MIVYRSMDRQALDAAYNNSAAVADSDRCLADWQRRSEALRARMPDHLDLVYGDAPRTRLSATPRRGSASSPKGRSPVASMSRSRATPWRPRLRWTE